MMTLKHSPLYSLPVTFHVAFYVKNILVQLSNEKLRRSAAKKIALKRFSNNCGILRLTVVITGYLYETFFKNCVAADVIFNVLLLSTFIFQC